MANPEYNPSRCEITKALVRPYGDNSRKLSQDITALIVNFRLMQSLDSTAIQISLECYDGIGLLENMPIRGEEEIELTIKGYDLDTQINLKGNIYKVDEVQPVKSRDAVTYTLSILSKSSYEASLRSIVKSYRRVAASSIAEDIFKQYFSGINPPVSEEKEDLPFNGKKYSLKNNDRRSLYIQPTEGLLRLTIPRYMPAEAMFYISSKSYSKDSPSCSFRFFENFDGYYFASDEFLIAKAVRNSKVKNLNYFTFSSLDPRDAINQITNIESMNNSRRTNVGEELMSGAYFNSVLEIDLNNHKASRYNYKYADEIQRKPFVTTSSPSTENATLGDDIHSIQFIEDTFKEENAKQYMIFRDYDTDQSGGKGDIVRGEQFYRQIVQQRSTYNLHINATKVVAEMKGRLDIQAGDILNINARKFNVAGDNSKQNTQLSGKYLVHSVTHAVKEGILDTKMQLIKYDWNKNKG